MISLQPDRTLCHTRLFSRRGHDWFHRFPRIREAVASLKARSVTIGGEAVLLCQKTGKHDREVILYAFDPLELNGKDQRELPLEERKARLSELLAPDRRDRAERTYYLRRTGQPCFATPAGLAARASCRSDAPQPTAQPSEEVDYGGGEFIARGKRLPSLPGL